MRLLQRIRNVLAPTTNQRHDWPAGLVALSLATCLWILSLALFDALSPTAYAAQEPAQDETDEEENDQGDSALHLNVTIDEDLTSEESDIIERKVAEAIERAVAQAEKQKALAEKHMAQAEKQMAQADKLKKDQVDKATRKVREKLAKVRLQHIELEKDARAKALADEKKATIEFQPAEKGKRVKERLSLRVNEDGAVILPADEAGPLTKAAVRLLLIDDEQGHVVLEQGSDERIDQLTAMVKKLSAQVDRLSKELQDLREGEERGGNDGEEDGPPKKF
jgi:hypothetical protein